MQNLNELAAMVFNVPAAELNDQSSRETVRTWDSLAHVTFMVAVEQTYGVKFAMREITEVRALADVRRMLQEKGVQV